MQLIIKIFQSVAPTIVLIVGVLRNFIDQEEILKMAKVTLDEALKRENSESLNRIANALEALIRLLEEEAEMNKYKITLHTLIESKWEVDAKDKKDARKLFAQGEGIFAEDKEKLLNTSIKSIEEVTDE
jgi:hypothetical protein